MRGSGDELTVGERIAFYRGRRQLTQVELANLVGRSEDWLSKIERGKRPIRRLDVLTEVARALRVTLPDLLGQPVLMEEGAKSDDVPAVRDALMAPRRLSRTLYGAAPIPDVIDLGRTRELVEFGWSDYQRGRVGSVVKVLPALIARVQQLEDAAPGLDGSEKRTCWSISARSHHLAATALSKFGESDLAWIAAERSMQAADRADDPLVLASAARAGTHALLTVGRFEDALDLGNTAASWLAPQMATDDPEALSLYGMLHLRMAVAAARHQDRQTTNELIGLARTAADQLGEDANYWQTGFGPTNVELHRLAAALDLGDVTYVADRAPDVSVLHLPVERRVSHRIDLARALSLTARDDAALQHLYEAEAEAPELVRHNPAVRETVKAIYRRAPVSGGRRSSELAGLAARCRVV